MREWGSLDVIMFMYFPLFVCRVIDSSRRVRVMRNVPGPRACTLFAFFRSICLLAPRSASYFHVDWSRRGSPIGPLSSTLCTKLPDGATFPCVCNELGPWDSQMSISARCKQGYTRRLTVNGVIVEITLSRTARQWYVCH
jgi:hypothetical protein